jgi:hypothetical protein
MMEQDLYDFGDALRANPRSFSQFTPQERAMVEAMLTPNPNFTDWQKVQVRQWKLLAPDQESLDYANAQLAVSGRPHRIAPRMATNGDLLLESDLLSDRAGNYAPIQSFLESLVLVARPESDFPQPEPDL